ncbi:MAG: hypothetical protein ABIQ99_14820 [Thermoflexales bacterium]
MFKSIRYAYVRLISIALLTTAGIGLAQLSAVSRVSASQAAIPPILTDAASYPVLASSIVTNADPADPVDAPSRIPEIIALMFGGLAALAIGSDPRAKHTPRK